MAIHYSLQILVQDRPIMSQTICLFLVLLGTYRRSGIDKCIWFQDFVGGTQGLLDIRVRHEQFPRPGCAGATVSSLKSPRFKYLRSPRFWSLMWSIVWTWIGVRGLRRSRGLSFCVGSHWPTISILLVFKVRQMSSVTRVVPGTWLGWFVLRIYRLRLLACAALLIVRLIAELQVVARRTEAAL